MWGLWLLGCGDGVTTPSPTGSCGTEAGVIALATRDGLRLEADFRPAPACGGGAVLLLHMIPPANDRTNWPPAFQDALVDAGFAVLALDRRGAGASEGDPEDAYRGPNGWLDALAAATFLRDEGTGPLTILGASNGTTTLLDYAVRARTQGAPEPVALGFLTGGTYTEAQTPMVELPPTPAVFTYSTDERAWSEAQRAIDPGSWAFLEYPDGAHGTGMFAAVPGFSDDLVSFVAAQGGPP